MNITCAPTFNSISFSIGNKCGGYSPVISAGYLKDFALNVFNALAFISSALALCVVNVIYPSASIELKSGFTK